MNNIVNDILVVYLVIIVFLIIIYLPRFRAWFGSMKKQKRIYNDKNNNIALLIPARDEIVVVPAMIESLKSQTYKNFTPYFIVKSKNDPSIKLIEEAGYVAFVCRTQKCKGDALDFALQEILKEDKDKFDNYLIIDADCLLDKDCLLEMNNACASGKDVIQSKRLVKNFLSKNPKDNNWVTKCNGIIWTLIDGMGNRYKSDHNITAMTIGTGIMLSKRVVNELGGWPYRKTLTEDIEFMYDATLRGYETFFYSYAHLYLEESPSYRATNTRRTRWMTGVVDSKRLYNDRLQNEMITKKQKQNKYFTTGLNTVYWLIGISALFCIVSLISTVIAYFVSPGIYLSTLRNAIVSFGVIYFSFFIMTVFAVIIDHKYIKIPWYEKIMLCFIHPFFYMGYIKIVFKAFFNLNTSKWEVIERVEGFEKD